MQESTQESTGIWNNKNIKLPDADGKYLVVVDCDGKKEITISSYFMKRKSFHFDMHHIKWNVIKWMKIPDIDESFCDCDWMDGNNKIEKYTYLSCNTCNKPI